MVTDEAAILSLVNTTLRLRALEVLQRAKAKLPGVPMRMEIRDGLPVIVVEGKEAIEREYGSEDRLPERFTRTLLLENP